MKKILYFFLFLNCLFFISCELFTAMLPGTRPTNNIGDSITASLIPEKKNYMDNDTQQKRIHYEESYPIEEEITLSISGCIDKTIYSDAIIQIRFEDDITADDAFEIINSFDDDPSFTSISETKYHKIEISISKDNLDKIEKNITFKVLSKGSYDIRVHVYAYSKKTNGYDGWCNKTLYFDCCEWLP